MARPEPGPTGDALRACVSEGECRPPHRSTKNTRDWCKGREGIPHTWEWLESKHSLAMAHVYSGTIWNRVTEQPICFGCGKESLRRRSYCRVCGEPWPTLVFLLHSTAGCSACGAPWRVRREARQE